MLNLWMFAGASHKARQAERLGAGAFDVLLLQEVTRAEVPGLASALGFDWWASSLGDEVRDPRIGVAVLGRSPVQLDARLQLAADDFVNDDVYPELARWFHERHLAVDVTMAPGRSMRIGAFHATPGTSEGPGTSTGRRGVGHRKPWFHRRIAEWVATWDPPFLFGIDANTPAVDALDLADSRFHISSQGPGRPGEEQLLGPPEVALHDGVDLWRLWLASPAGAGDLAAVPEGGPLARSHRTRSGSWFRYDQIWASPGIRPVAMAYEFDDEVSDHALVSATIDW